MGREMRRPLWGEIRFGTNFVSNSVPSSSWSAPVSWGHGASLFHWDHQQQPHHKIIQMSRTHQTLMERNRITSLDLAINLMTSHESCQSPVQVTGVCSCFQILGRKEKIEVVSWDSRGADVNWLLFMTLCSLFFVKTMFPRILCLNFFLWMALIGVQKTFTHYSCDSEVGKKVYCKFWEC